MKKLSWMASSLCLCLPLAGLADTDGIYQLGEVKVTGTAQAEVDTTNSVDQQAMRAQDKATVGGALSLLPGVELTRGGARNEEQVSIRGFDLRQVPVFIDGIPVYVPYDGYVDLGRFNTFDLARIDVQKGFSSAVYGPNTLGGAINLVTRKPTKPFEAEVGAGLGLTSQGEGNRYLTYANLGSRQADWYMQLGVSYVDQDYYRLPHGFDATAGEDGGRRDNSYQTDRKVNLKVGYLPNATDEYSLNYINQHGKKGNPPYASTLSKPRYWQWPYWDKESLYYISNTRLGSQLVKLRLYYDTYQNSLYSYDDNTYSSQNAKYAFQSWYDDYTYGGSLEDAIDLLPTNRLKLAYHWKKDVHREHDGGEPLQHFADVTQSLAAEDSHQLTEALSLVVGLGYDWRTTKQAEDYSTGNGLTDFDRGDTHATNGQLGLFYQLSPVARAHLTLAHKSRFPTIKDRYSYRLGTAIPNPDLKVERANHYELGYEDVLADNWLWHTNLFYSRIQDLIQSDVIDSGLCSNPPCSQMHNVGKARAQGLEFGLQGQIGDWELGTSYTYLDRKNLSDPNVKLTGTPRQAMTALVRWTPITPLTLQLTEEANGDRYSSSDGKQKAAGFAITNAKLGYQYNPALRLELSVDNLFDTRYEYVEGFPEAGRNALMQFHYQL